LWRAIRRLSRAKPRGGGEPARNPGPARQWLGPHR
jgi:hypothetical protein